MLTYTDQCVCQEQLSDTLWQLPETGLCITHIWLVLQRPVPDIILSLHVYIHMSYNDKFMTDLLKGQGGTVHNVPALCSYMPKLLEWYKKNQKWLDMECMYLLGMTKISVESRHE